MNEFLLRAQCFLEELYGVLQDVVTGDDSLNDQISSHAPRQTSRFELLPEQRQLFQTESLYKGLRTVTQTFR